MGQIGGCGFCAVWLARSLGFGRLLVVRIATIRVLAWRPTAPGGNFVESTLVIEMVGIPPGGQSRRHVIPKGKGNDLWQRGGMSEDE